MIALKERHKSPPNGFQFTQAETGKSWTWWDFEQGVREIRDHRLGNPRFNLSADPDDIRNELDNVNALRCLSIRGGEIYVNQDSSPAPPKQNPRSGLLHAAGGVGKIAAGAVTLASWLGNGGKPVSHELAESRSQVCAVCPKNGKAGLTHYFTDAAAATIRKMVEQRNAMKLSTSADEQLGTCEACLCNLRLKCFVPLNEIVSRMSDDVKTALDPGCWVLSEK